MSTAAISGVGALMYRWDGSMFEEVAEVNSLTFDGFSRETIDVTDLKSASNNNGYRSKITGLRDSGTLSLNVNYTRSDYINKWKSDFESDNARTYRVVLPDDDVTFLEFQGYVTELPLDIPMEEKVASDVTIEITDDVVVGNGSVSSIGELGSAESESGF
jgi:predicted secreted protein